MSTDARGGVETHIMRLYSCAVAFIKIVRRLVETCHWRVSSARNALPTAVWWNVMRRLAMRRASGGNETRQWHVSTSQKHPLSVISPYDVETHNMRLIGRRCIINGSTGWGGDAYYASLQLYCCIHKIVRRVVETCHWRVSSARNALPTAVWWNVMRRLAMRRASGRQWHVSTSRKHPLSVISPYDVETHNMRLPDRR